MGNITAPAWMSGQFASEEEARDTLRENTYEIVPYLVKDGKKHKVAVICPGGGYNRVCSFVEGRPFAQALNRMGISAVVVYYRCREKARYPAPQEDLARAVREIHARAEEWSLDMTGYSVWGSSAGGHLAGSFGTENMGYLHFDLPRPGAMVLVYPVITMGEFTHEGTRENLLGKAPTQAEKHFASIEQNVTQNYPPTFLWCGDADSCVPPANSHLMAAALTQAGVVHMFREYPGVEHGVGLGTGLACEGWLREAVAFWMEQTNS